MEGCLLFCIHLQPKLHFWAFKQSRLSQSQTESDNALRAKNISLFCQLDFLSQTTEGSTWIKEGGCVCVPYTEMQTRKKLQIFWLSQSDWSTVFFLQTQPAATSHMLLRGKKSRFPPCPWIFHLRVEKQQKISHQISTWELPQLREPLGLGWRISSPLKGRSWLCGCDAPKVLFDLWLILTELLREDYAVLPVPCFEWNCWNTSSCIWKYICTCTTPKWSNTAADRGGERGLKERNKKRSRGGEGNAEADHTQWVSSALWTRQLFK